MVRCFHSKRYRIEQATGRILTLLETVVVAGLGVYFLVTAEDCRREAGALLALGMLIGLYGIFSDLIGTREYGIAAWMRRGSNEATHKKRRLTAIGKASFRILGIGVS